MRGKFITGAIVGAAVGMMLMPEMDRSTKRKIKRTSKNIMNTAEGMYDGMMNWMK